MDSTCNATSFRRRCGRGEKAAMATRRYRTLSSLHNNNHMGRFRLLQSSGGSSKDGGSAPKNLIYNYESTGGPHLALFARINGDPRMSGRGPLLCHSRRSGSYLVP